MTRTWGDEETAEVGYDITIINIPNLKSFCEQVVDNYYSIDSDNNFEKVYLPRFDN